MDARDPRRPAFDFDLDKAKQILDDAGYKDTDGDGIREMPGGGEPLKMRYAVRSESVAGSQPTAEFITGWLKDIGIATTQKVYDDSQLTEVIGKGDYDLFVWGWTPFVDPDPMLSYFTCDQVSQDPKDPTNYYNDANWCDPEYDKLYKQQKTELDPAKRIEIVHEMLTRFYESADYVRSTRRATCRPTARTSSRAGCASRRRPGRCCSPTRRRATRR